MIVVAARDCVVGRTLIAKEFLDKDEGKGYDFHADLLEAYANSTVVEVEIWWGVRKCDYLEEYPLIDSIDEDPAEAYDAGQPPEDAAGSLQVAGPEVAALQEGKLEDAAQRSLKEQLGGEATHIA